MLSLRDPLDEWSRFRQLLRERRVEIARDIIGGQLSPERYAAECARVQMVDEVLDLAEKVRKGEDVNPPQQERLRSVEEC